MLSSALPTSSGWAIDSRAPLAGWLPKGSNGFFGSSTCWSFCSSSDARPLTCTCSDRRRNCSPASAW